MMASQDGYRTYLFSYEHQGAKWGFDIKAKSAEDAKARVAKLARADFDGELVTSFRVPTLSGRLARWLGLG